MSNVILDSYQINQKIKRLSYEIYENNLSFGIFMTCSHVKKSDPLFDKFLFINAGPFKYFKLRFRYPLTFF